MARLGDVADNNHGSDQVDRLARCTTELHKNIASLTTTVDGNQSSLDDVQAQLASVSTRLDHVTAQLDALSASMTARFNHVDTLLCTPQGQRACFPGGGGR